MSKHAVYVYQNPQTFSFSGTGILGSRILKVLRSEVESRHLDWTVSLDETGGDFSQIKERNYDLVICEPSIRTWLQLSKLDLNKVIVLNPTEYYLCITKNYKSSVKRILDLMMI